MYEYDPEMGYTSPDWNTILTPAHLEYSGKEFSISHLDTDTYMIESGLIFDRSWFEEE